MVNVSFKHEINAPAAKVWNILGDFNALPSFIPAVTNSQKEGDGVNALRTLTMAGGIKVKEKLGHQDHSAMMLKDSIVEVVLLVQDYLSALKVHATGDDTSEVEWFGRCTSEGMPDEDVEKIVTGMYTGGLKALSVHMDA
jgi:Polyketide cyclase / dehydrase and lipid transport